MIDMQEGDKDIVEPQDKKFPVMEIFGPTIQGEGNVIGLRTHFIRFGGCDYRCKMCDSLHAVLPRLIKKHATRMTVEQIAEEVGKLPKAPMVTFSGGNPAMHDLTELVEVIHNQNLMDVAVETQGTIWRDWIANCDYITVSPKGPGMGEKFEPDKFDAFMREMPWHSRRHSIAIKVVIFGQEDIEFAKHLESQYQFGPRLFLSLGNSQPPNPNKPANTGEDADEFDLSAQLLNRMVTLWEDISKEDLLAQARFLPQLHVLLWGNKAGV